MNPDNLLLLQIVSDRNLLEEFNKLDFSRELQTGPQTFGLKVLALLISEEVYRNCGTFPSLSGKQKQDTQLKPEVVEAFKQLLQFFGGSVIAPESLDKWLNAIQTSISNKKGIFPASSEPVFESAFVEEDL